MPLFQKKVSLVSNLKRLIGSPTIAEIAEAIRKGSYEKLLKSKITLDLKDQILKIRSCEDKVQKNDLKKRLLAFTNSGVFKGGRKAENLETYSGLVQIDMDGLTAEQIQEARKYAESDCSVLLGFVSPSGNGYKFIIAVDTMNDSQQNENAFKCVVNHVSKESNLPVNRIDRSTKDLARLCYLSYDPHVYLNEKCIPLHISGVNTSQKYAEFAQPDLEAPANEPISYTELIDSKYAQLHDIFIELEKAGENTEGNRNNCITKFAGICNSQGFDIDDCIAVATKRSALSQEEVVSTVKGVYKRYEVQHNTVTHQKLEIDSEYFPRFVYENLPELIQPLFGTLSHREKDILLLSVLTSLSACFPEVYFEDSDGSKLFLNLASFIVAPSAHNKSKARYAKALVKQLAHYIQTLPIDLSNHKEEETHDKRMFIIPGNNSYAGIIKCLVHSKGIGLIHETEADVVGQNLSKEWGNFSTVMRNAASNEPITSFRATDKEHIEIELPKLAIFLTGTPDQVRRIIPNSDNGLFSRILFYTFKEGYFFINKFRKGKNGRKLSEVIPDLSDQIFEIAKHRLSHGFEFELTEEQHDLIDEFYHDPFKKLDVSQKAITRDYIYRSVITLHRITGILTTLRLGKRLTDKVVTPIDVDFKIAFEIVKTCLLHSVFVLPNNKEDNPYFGSEDRMAFFKELPNEFKRNESIDLALSIGIPKRTADEWLKGFVEQNHLKKVSHGTYRKT